MKSYRVIGLTGGIGAGKSEAAKRFFRLGAQVIDADVVARRSLEIDGCCYKEVVEAFGEKIIRSDGSIDRNALASLVFSDKQCRKTLDNIVHPYVISEMFQQAKQCYDADARSIIVLDIPLMFECGIEKSVDQSLLVLADDSLRLNRIVTRNGISRDAAALRISSQMPQHEKQARADFLINNNGPIEALYGQVDLLFQLFTVETP